MKFSEVGFRGIYHKYCVFNLNERFKAVVKDYPGFNKANAVVTYGYYDRQAGLSLEVLACAKMDDNGAYFFEPNNDTRVTIRIGAVKNEEFSIFENENNNIYERYKDKIDALDIFKANEDIEKTREWTFLDASRDTYCIDDVLVYLVSKFNKMEGCYVRINKLDEHAIIGTLLNEPYQDFKCHKGDEIVFQLYQKEDKGYICYSDLNRKILEDGKLLEKAIHKFNLERNKENLIYILKILQDSYLWVPCNAIMSDIDYEKIENLVNNSNNLDDLVGTEFKSEGQTRLVPDILQNGEYYFFPAFSNVEAMGEYGNKFSKVEKHMLEIINLARNNKQDLQGIVINAFSESFVLDKEAWNLLGRNRK